MNLVLECLDPEYVDELRALNERIVTRAKDGGEYLKYNPCYINGLAIHFNQDGTLHYDGKSLHAGWDLIQGFGHYFGSVMELRDLKTHAKFDPTDMMGIRGASLAHVASGWEGAGRMVLVPFIERRVFGHSDSSRPVQFHPPFYHDHHKIKHLFPSQPLRHH